MKVTLAKMEQQLEMVVTLRFRKMVSILFML